MLTRGGTGRQKTRQEQSPENVTYFVLSRLAKKSTHKKMGLQFGFNSEMEPDRTELVPYDLLTYLLTIYHNLLFISFFFCLLIN